MAYDSFLVAVETLKFGGDPEGMGYTRYEGRPLKKVMTVIDGKERWAHIMGSKASVMP